MRWILLLSAALGVVSAQSGFQGLIDSLIAYRRPGEALAVYDSLERWRGISVREQAQLEIGRVEAYVSLLRFTEAQIAAQRAESLAIIAGDTLVLADKRVALGWAWIRQNQLYKAESLLTAARRLYERTRSYTSYPGYVRCLHRLGYIADRRGKYAEAERLYGDALALWIRVLGREHPNYAGTLHNLAMTYKAQGRYTEAESLYSEALELWGQLLGQDHPEYINTLGALANVYKDQGRYGEAEKAYTDALALYERLQGRENVDYVRVMNNLALLYSAQGRYAEAEKIFREVLGLRARLLGAESPEYAHTLNNLAVLYANQGRYVEAEGMFREVLGLRARLLGREHPEYANALNNLANVYYARGRYVEAEGVFREVLVLRARLFGQEHPEYANILNNLANVYSAQGRYREAEYVFREVLELRGRLLGREHPEYTIALGNLANMYAEQERFQEAEQAFLEVLSVQERVLGEIHPTYAIMLSNLANLYLWQRRYEEAERTFLKASALQLRLFGRMHPDYATTLNNLAAMYFKQGRYAAAESLFVEAKSIRSKALGVEHLDYLASLRALAILYGKQEQYERAASLWREEVQLTFRLMHRELPGMVAAHRQSFLENILSTDFQSFQRYIAQRGAAIPSMLELGYRAARSLKGLVLASVEGMRYLIEQQEVGDTILKRLYVEWIQLREQYAFYALQERQREADSVLGLAIERERAMIARLPELVQYFPDIEGEPLYPPLRREEAVVEVVRVPYEEGDSVLYLYYLIVPEGRKHRLSLYVRRVSGAWERQVLFAYEILRSPGAEVTGSAYRLLWGEIDSVLPKGVRVVYFSPDGVYYRVNVSTLYDGRVFLGDRYEVRYVASSRRLLGKRAKVASGRASVIGSPNFYSLPGEVRAPGVRSVRYFAGGVPPLPGAEAEARRVAELLGVEAVVSDSATEEYVKSLRGPEVLHIATHGYFVSEGRDVMLSGGLLLAQAGVWDSLYAPYGVEDGRLTAQEASNLNLIGTRLVVLSACETGLGEVKGEGLYGLQRGFLEAGAERVIAALWQVDDAATRELMESFYRAWQKERKKPAEAVFARVLKDFRKRYPEPYYWGAFVVMR